MGEWFVGHLHRSYLMTRRERNGMEYEARDQQYGWMRAGRAYARRVGSRGSLACFACGFRKREHSLIRWAKERGQYPEMR